MNAVRQPGLKVGPYELAAPLGAGGMGEVWLARDTRLGREVAIKFAHEEFNERFEREARAIAALNHPHIATLHDVGPDYLVMERVEGEPVRGPMPPAEVVRVARQIASALAAAHAKGIVHRDLKPANILLAANGVKLLDFGLAKQDANAAGAMDGTVEMTSRDVIAGTPQYMSPEQARGLPVGPASDLYSLGAVLYSCLAGHPPFRGGGVDVLLQVLQDPPPPLPAAGGALNAIVLQLLEKDPARRFTSANELLGELDKLAAGEGSGDAPTVWLAPPRPAAQRRPWSRKWVAAAAVVVLAATGVSAWRLSVARPAEPTPDALRWYVEGANALRDGTFYKASRTLERAVALDPKFTMARIRLAEAWSELDSSDKARESILQAAGAGAKRLPERERLLMEAVQLTLTGEYGAAVERHRRLLAMASDEEKPGALVDLGRALEKAEQPVAAIESYREAARLSPQYAAAFLRLGVLLARRQDIAGAEETFRQAESHYRQLGATEGEIEVSYQRALMLKRAGQLDQASKLVEGALDRARHNQAPHQQIALLIQRSEIAARRGLTDEAGEHATTGIELARRAQLESLIARGLIDLGNAHFLGRNPAAAEDFYRQALEYARRWKNRRTEARALLSLGSFKIQHGRLAEGVPDVEAAVAYYRGTESRNETIQGLILLARAARDLGDYAKAEALFRQQFEFARQANLPEPASNALNGLATLTMHQESYSEARDLYAQALEALGAAATPTQRAYALLGIASAEIQLGRLQEARRLQAEALDAVRGLGAEAAIQRHCAAQLLAISVVERRPQAALLAGAQNADAAAACLAAGQLRNREAARRFCPGAPAVFAAESYLEAGDLQPAKDAAVRGLERAKAERRLEAEFRAAYVLSRLSPADAGLRDAARASWDQWRGSWKPEEFRVYTTRPDVRHRLRLLQQ